MKDPGTVERIVVLPLDAHVELERKDGNASPPPGSPRLAPGVADDVLRHAEEKAPEAPAALLDLAEHAPPDDREEHVLRDVLGLRPPESLLPDEGPHRRTVALDESRDGARLVALRAVDHVPQGAGEI